MYQNIVVVGSSVAGVRTAQALRGQGFTGRVLLIGEETELPYDRPPLSKQFLAGQWDRAGVALLTEAEARAAAIGLRLGNAATGLDLDRQEVMLDDGTRVPYDACVVATGSSARPSPWAAGSGVHVLRRLADSTALRAELGRGQRIAVVGGGFIGAEVATTARGLGCSVLVIDPLPVPIARVLGRRVGELFADLPARAGVETAFGVGVEQVSGRSGDLLLRLGDGRAVPADTVVVGIGAVPNDQWLTSSGLLIDDGVVCDEYCQAVGAGNVFAVGDVARWYHVKYAELVRVEHWTNAADQAVHVAGTLTHPGRTTPYQPVEYVWSDQYGGKIQITGRPRASIAHHVVGHLRGATARAAVLCGDRSGSLCGAVTLNWPRALLECRRQLGLGVTYAEAVARVEALSRPGSPGRRKERQSR